MPSSCTYRVRTADIPARARVACNAKDSVRGPPPVARRGRGRRRGLLPRRPHKCNTPAPARLSCYLLVLSPGGSSMQWSVKSETNQTNSPCALSRPSPRGTDEWRVPRSLRSRAWMSGGVREQSGWYVLAARRQGHEAGCTACTAAGPRSVRRHGSGCGGSSPQRQRGMLWSGRGADEASAKLRWTMTSPAAAGHNNNHDWVESAWHSLLFDPFGLANRQGQPAYLYLIWSLLHAWLSLLISNISQNRPNLIINKSVSLNKY